MLPTPEPLLAQRSQKLADKIQQQIHDNQGWIGFDCFMQEALYCPGLGYYSGPQQKFGEKGDFITAPMLGDLFAQCLARQTAQILEQCDNSNVYEFGPGDGSLARGLLQALDDLGALPRVYYLIETSAELRDRQQQTLMALSDELTARVEWLDQLPDSLTGVVIGNELLDAIPFKRFKVNEDCNCNELGVALSDGEFCWQVNQSHSIPMPNDLNLYQGYQSEKSIQGEAWVRTVGDILQTGIVLLIDYGFPCAEYYHADRATGTLMCHFRQYSHSDPFFWPGLQDITAHIDFTAMTTAAKSSGLSLLGYCDQANFLLSCGLLDLLTQHQSNPQFGQQLIMERTAEVKKLTLPHEMGELFKVIAFGKNFQQPLCGFTRRNQTHRLGQCE